MVGITCSKAIFMGCTVYVKMDYTTNNYLDTLRGLGVWKHHLQNVLCQCPKCRASSCGSLVHLHWSCYSAHDLEACHQFRVPQPSPLSAIWGLEKTRSCSRALASQCNGTAANASASRFQNFWEIKIWWFPKLSSTLWSSNMACLNIPHFMDIFL